MNGKFTDLYGAEGRGKFLKLKHFGGSIYYGIPVGSKHKWHYSGTWTERKITPDMWLINFRAEKYRAGTELSSDILTENGPAYHWFIIADQIAVKKGRDVYDISMPGIKFKINTAETGDKLAGFIRSGKYKREIIRILEDALRKLRYAV